MLVLSAKEEDAVLTDTLIIGPRHASSHIDVVLITTQVMRARYKDIFRLGDIDKDHMLRQIPKGGQLQNTLETFTTSHDIPITTT
jgi:hypothetical protein